MFHISISTTKLPWTESFRLREAASEPAAVSIIADVKHPARQRQQLQHPHAGQIEYLRGLVKHQGWFPAAEK